MINLRQLKRISFVVNLIFNIFVVFSNSNSQNTSPQGFASMNVLGQNGTTGGSGGSIVTVTNSADFISHIWSTDVVVIQVADTIHLSSMVGVNSNKTIIGIGDQGIITGGGLHINGKSNIIIQNLLFENSMDDAINVQESSHHIWINHCDFTNSYDGLVDIKRGSEYITVSWNKFYNHGKTCLLGHSDNNGAQDSTHLLVTYHHNWFDSTNTRNPRVRFSGLAHVFNNYYNNNEYGIASTMNANVFVENNYFFMVIDPTLVGYAASGPGLLEQTGNIFDNCTNAPEDSGTVPSPPYIYQLDDAASIPAIVQASAGRIGYLPQPWKIYNASVLPSSNDPSYIAENLNNPPDTTSWIIDDPDIPGNQLLKFVNDSNSSRFMWGIDWNMSASTGVTIAFRIKPINANCYDRSFEVEFRDGSLSERLFLLPGGIVELERANITAPLHDRPDGWHTYRITFQNGDTKVYIDEQPISFLNGITTTSNSSNNLRFGDGSVNNTYGFYMDWFIFDTSGAFTPGESRIPYDLYVDHPDPLPEPWKVYNANVLPDENDPAFALGNISNPPDTSSWIIDDPDVPGNKLLKFISNVSNSRIMWDIDWSMNAVNGATLAFRIKPIDVNFYDRIFEVEYRDGSIREKFFLLPGGTIELDMANSTAPLPNNADEWHTYRITYQNGKSTVYVDEQSVPLLSGVSASSSSSNDFRFGDGSNSYTYGFYLDWLIFDDSGSFAPGESFIPDSLIIDSSSVSLIENTDQRNSLSSYSLYQNYPNPFNPTTTIKFTLSEPAHIKLSVFNTLGQEILELINEFKIAGNHQINIDATTLSSGIYYYKLQVDNSSQIKKMILTK